MTTSAVDIAETLSSFTPLLGTLGDIPEKPLINSLTMAAEDILDVKAGAVALWTVLSNELNKSKDGRTMSIVYLIDSILVNADDCKMFHDVAMKNMRKTLTYVIQNSKLADKAERLVNIWSNDRKYDTSSFKGVFQEFRDAKLRPGAGGAASGQDDDGAAIVLTALPTAVREEMQAMLRQMQEEMGEDDPMR